VQDVLAERVGEGAITAKQLGHDVMPAITEAIEEESFSESEKRDVVKKIVREASSEPSWRAIVRQERGMKKLRRDGVDLQIWSNQNAQRNARC